MRISVIGTNPEKMAAIEMEIKSVAVLGAGAVGSYIIWGLYENKNKIRADCPRSQNGA